jgi:uncharacterized membrane protein YhaH (DUF805 family)
MFCISLLNGPLNRFWFLTCALVSGNVFVWLATQTAIVCSAKSQSETGVWLQAITLFGVYVLFGAYWTLFTTRRLLDMGSSRWWSIPFATFVVVVTLGTYSMNRGGMLVVLAHAPLMILGTKRAKLKSR